MSHDAEIAAVRRFNRFYTRRIGVLEEGYSRSPWTLAEARVLYELAQVDETNSTTLAEALGLDAGYLSRILKRFDEAGLIRRRQDPEDGRAQRLGLSPAGRDAFAPLDATARAEMGALLDRLDAPARARLVAAMAEIERLIAPADRPAIVLRDPRPGDFGEIVAGQARIYAEEYGWDGTFEALVARIVADFVEGFRPGRERAFVADLDGRVVGSVFLVAKDDTTAKLRMLYVDRAARGHGLGSRLVDACLAAAREAGYRRIELWTNDVLSAARHIYEARGFVLVSEERHHSFGKDLVGQVFAKDLA